MEAEVEVEAEAEAEKAFFTDDFNHKERSAKRTSAQYRPKPRFGAGMRAKVEVECERDMKEERRQ